MENKDIYILSIESSCDDTSAAVLRNTTLLSNVTASQAVHCAYGGVVPELASRAHQQNVVPVVDQALKRAGITKEQLSAVAFTRGPGLMGSLLVGVSFAKGFARSLDIPLIDVNHLQGHVMAHFIDEDGLDNPHPPLPFICLLVSGGNSQIVKVNAYNDMEVLGQTIDDAAGEAIDKCSKVMGLGYPGGPIIDKLARQGNPLAYQFAEPHIPGLDYSFSGLKTSFLYSLQKWVQEDPDFVEHHKNDLAASLEHTIVDKLARQGNPLAYQFAEPHIPGLDYSFSGLKTSFLYSLQKWVQEDPDFVEHHKNDLAASLEHTIVDILMKKLRMAVKQTGIKHVAVAGGVSANNGLRNAFREHAEKYGWTIYIPKFSYTTDNAAMIGVVGYYKYRDHDFCSIDAPAFSKVTFK